MPISLEKTIIFEERKCVFKVQTVPKISKNHNDVIAMTQRKPQELGTIIETPVNKK